MNKPHKPRLHLWQKKMHLGSEYIPVKSGVWWVFLDGLSVQSCRFEIIPSFEEFISLIFQWCLCFCIWFSHLLYHSNLLLGYGGFLGLLGFSQIFVALFYFNMFVLNFAPLILPHFQFWAPLNNCRSFLYVIHFYKYWFIMFVRLEIIYFINLEKLSKWFMFTD